MSDSSLNVDGVAIGFVELEPGRWHVVRSSSPGETLGRLELSEDGTRFKAYTADGEPLTTASAWGGAAPARFASRALAAKALLEARG